MAVNRINGAEKILDPARRVKRRNQISSTHRWTQKLSMLLGPLLFIHSTRLCGSNVV